MLITLIEIPHGCFSLVELPAWDIVSVTADVPPVIWHSAAVASCAARTYVAQPIVTLLGTMPYVDFEHTPCTTETVKCREKNINITGYIF